MKTILTINGGSSSIKFSLFDSKDENEFIQKMNGVISGIGLSNTNFKVKYDLSKTNEQFEIVVKNHDEAIHYLMEWLLKQKLIQNLTAVGHRIVHGMAHTKSEIVNQALLNELHENEIYDPNHLPHEISIIEIFQKYDPSLMQVACFDTAFHSEMPKVAKLLPIPRHYYDQGIRRYGFHGLSYAYLMDHLRKLLGEKINDERIILAHLGNGASLAAIKAGKSIDTTMGFTPAAGLIMSTRSGDIDPGLVSFFLQNENMDAIQFDKMINSQSGLIGISEISSDMRVLLEREDEDIRAKEAVDAFCYRAKKWIGAYAALLGGVDRIVFTAGIGENSPVIRARICDGLDFMGVCLDKTRNQKNETIISSDKSRVVVYVIPTNEELMIARETYHHVLNLEVV